MSTIEILIDEVKQAPDTMLEEVLDFVRFLKSSRFAPSVAGNDAVTDAAVEVIFDKPRTLSDLANEQRTFFASIPTQMIDIDLPSNI